MKTYISLVTFTEKALQDIQKSPQRAKTFIKKAKDAGASVEGLYWTVGPYDGVLVLKAKNDAAVAALMLSLNSKGYVKTSIAGLPSSE